MGSRSDNTVDEDGSKINVIPSIGPASLIAFKKYSFEKFKYALGRTSTELKELSINSPTTAYVVQKIMNDEGKSEDEARKMVVEIIDEIGHGLNFKIVPIMAYLVGKITSILFRNVFLNKRGLDQLREIIKLGPVVFAPSHNSYFDFLLLSFVCFLVDLPLPAIASGQDFLHIAIVNRLLRASGAFYMRRTFADDECYKLLFKEYVQNVVAAGDMPFEFFVEGTRSRNGKASHPKNGLLSMVNETYYTGRSPDIFFCPVSISFECIPEENLYTYELLGLPKPKESLSGIFKAKSILAKDYGSVNIHFGKILSLEEASKSSIDRSLYNAPIRTSPKYQKELKQQEKIVNHEIGKLLVHEQQQNMTLYLRSIVAAVMLQRESGCPLDKLLFECNVVTDFLKKTNCKLGMSGAVDSVSLEKAITLLEPSLQITDAKLVEKIPSMAITRELKASLLGQCLDGSTHLGNAITDIYLSQQRNRLLLRCALPAFITSSVRARKIEAFTLDDICEDVRFLHDLMKWELVYHPHRDIVEEIEEALDLLLRTSCIKEKHLSGRKSFELLDTPTSKWLVSFLVELLEPFLEAYWFVCQIILSHPITTPVATSKVAQEMQLHAGEAIKQGIIKKHEVLSLQTLKTVLKFLVKSEALVSSRNSSLQQFVCGVKPEVVSQIIGRISDTSQLPKQRLQVVENKLVFTGNL